MRIISQDGKDYPYESLVLSVEHSSYTDAYLICGRVIGSLTNTAEILAKYTTKDRCDNAMRGMYKEYKHYSANSGSDLYPKIYRFPDDESEGADERELKESQK